MRLGADPETFLKDRTGKHISAIGLIGANKWAPLQVPDLPEGFTLQEDNVALEFGQPPAATEDEFVFNTRRAMLAGLQKLPKMRFSRLSCTIFDADQMTHPVAHIFGCEPDYNAWTGEENVKPTPPHPYMRSAGGHVHIELLNVSEQRKRDVICASDLLLAVPSVLMDPYSDRRKLYGRAGACRFKPYGVEYRTLSNFWIYDKRLIRWVWRNVERALAFDVSLLSDKDLVEEIQTCINESDTWLARELVKEFELEVMDVR